MREQFRNWTPPKKIVITYKDPDNQSIKKRVELDGEILFNSIISTIKTYGELGLKLTNREIYYQLVKENAIPNVMEVYKRLCVFLTDARYGGWIDWDAIEDRSRSAGMPSEWEDVEDLIASAVASYRLQRWKDQEYYVEMYCEKEAGEGKLKPVADKYHIHFGANKGYSSASMIYEMSKRLKEQLQNNKKVVILYFGDHDPSGLDMIRDIKDRLTEFLENDISFEDHYFEVVQIALNRQQITQFNCPPNPAKITDPRAKWYIEKYGKVSWELDALAPDVLIKLAELAVQEYIDIDAYNAIIQREQKEIDSLKRYGKNLKKKGEQQ
jgi:hypothetical protein